MLGIDLSTTCAGVALSTGVPVPPPGYALRMTSEGQPVQDARGNYEIVRIA